VADRAAAGLEERYATLQIAGCYAGSPSLLERDYIVDLIRRSRADLLFVAFGAPQQDVWIARELRSTGVSVAIGVGGSFDYVAGIARRAPRWMQEHSLEWLWRLLNQPWRWRRMLALPRFVWLVWRDQQRRERPKGKDLDGCDGGSPDH
jgi:N-acetylglucosaminyldiphosphoundecaprenol N-acetyl-beta-D-mannosaminyltransferase